MKYYHIIYNSSEKSMDGGVGFGIRTATEGTPEGLLRAIKDIQFFTDDWESYENKPTPAQIKDNPSSLERIPMNYAVTEIVDCQGVHYHVIARRAYVGFDYGFYKNGMPTRPGNYVIDYYVFDDIPERNAYEILYEDAKDGANHFVPKSVCPTIDNAEMVQISLGMQPALPIESKDFSAHLEDCLDKDVVRLFFAYLQAKKEGQKLVVSVSQKKSAKLLADFYRMFDSKSAAGIRSYINLRTQGTNENFDIFFIHDDYPHQIYPGLFHFLDLKTTSMPDTQEARNFALDMESFVTRNFENHRSDLDDILKWLAMPEFDMVKNLSKKTNDAFFRYCIHPEGFMYEDLRNEDGSLNKELVEVLCHYINRKQGNSSRLNKVVLDALNSVSPDTVISQLSDYNALCEFGVNLDVITKEVQDSICFQLLSSVELLKKGIDEIGYDNLQKFFVHSLFVKKSEYQDSPLLDKYIVKLYKLFNEDGELENKVNILCRFLKRDMDFSIMCDMIEDIMPKADDRLNFFSLALKKDLFPFSIIWKYYNYYLEKIAQCPNFIDEFKEKHSEALYAPMFYYYLKRNRSNLRSSQLSEITSLLEKNIKLKRLVEDGFSKDNIYKAIFAEIDLLCDNNPDHAHRLIQENILGFLNVRDEQWIILDAYIKLIRGDVSSIIKTYDEHLICEVFDKVKGHKNKKLFDLLLSRFLMLTKKGLIPIESIVDTYCQFYPEKDTESMLGEMDDHRGWQQLLEYVLIDKHRTTFRESLRILSNLGYNDVVIGPFLNEYYGMEYRVYKLTDKIKKGFSSIVMTISNMKKDKKSSHKGLKTKKH